MITPVRLAIIAACLLLAPAPRAHACSCVEMTPAQYIKQADQVYLAKAGKLQTRGKERRRTFEVLLTIKGEATRKWTRVTDAGAESPCPVRFDDGAATLLFIKKGTLFLCSGNFPMGGHLQDMGKYLAKVKPTAADKGGVPLEVMNAALFKALAGYLHGRPKVPLHHKALKGKQLKLGKTTMPVVGRAKNPRKTKGVVMGRAMRRGDVHYITGTYPTEGLAFSVLLLKRQGKTLILGSSTVER